MTGPTAGTAGGTAGDPGEGPVRYHWPDTIGYLVDRDRLILAVLPDGEPKAVVGSGPAIWQLADGATAEEIAAQLAEAYGQDPGRLLPGVRQFCSELIELGFLRAD